MWIAVGLILFSLAFTALYAIANKQPINSVILSQEVLQVLMQIVVGCLLAALIADLLLSTLLLFIPFYTGRALLWSVRKIANYVVIKWQHDPIKIPHIILSAFFLILTLLSYFINLSSILKYGYLSCFDLIIVDSWFFFRRSNKR